MALVKTEQSAGAPDVHPFVGLGYHAPEDRAIIPLVVVAEEVVAVWGGEVQIKNPA